MKLQIEIEVDEAMLQSVAKAAVASAFKAEDRLYGSSSAGPAYNRVKAEVERQLSEMDFAPFVSAEISRKLESVVREVTHEELKRAVRKAAKELQTESELLPKTNETKPV